MKRRNIRTSHHRKAACGFAPACLCALILVTAPGCASSGRPPRTDSNLGVVSEQVETPTRTLLHNADRGLEVHQWLIADDVDLISATMGRYREADVLTDAERGRLRRNGLRLVRVPLDKLDDLEADLGGAFVRNVGRHGQILDWQELLSRPLPQQRALAVDGRVRLFNGGRIRLMTRAWLVQMEDGPRLNVQIVPQHLRPAPLSYYRLLGRDTGEATPITSMTMDVILEHGYAYVLTCESPLADWHGVDVENDGQDEREQRSVATAGPAGPDAPGPTTVGQLLLRREVGASTQPGRAVLILIPRIHSPADRDLSARARAIRPARGPSQP